jgi:hypothetical protein
MVPSWWKFSDGAAGGGSAAGNQLSWYQDRVYVVLHADREGLPDMKKLADTVEPVASALPLSLSEHPRASGECR